MGCFCCDVRSCKISVHDLGLAGEGLYTALVKNIGVIVNTKRPRSPDILAELGRLAAGHGLRLYAENTDLLSVLGAEHLPVDAFPGKVDVALAMGGDGTVLYTARALHGAGIPILGINLGSLGFLTSVGDSEIAKALETLVNSGFKGSVRDMARCRIFEGDTLVGEECALNDMVVGWGATSRIVTLRLTINGEPVSSFMCDGMMVSTPTGSTGHSLSAGGPILHPGICGFGINVICPHTLSSRPLVIPDSSLIEIEVVQAAKELILSIDGQDEYRLDQGGRIEISKSPHGVEFLEFPEHSYFALLAKKLHWRGSSL